MQQKRCFKCGVTQPLDAFYKHSKMADGHLGKCKACTKIDSRASYYADPDAANERVRLRNANHPEKLKAYYQRPEVKARKTETRARSAMRHPERRAAVYSVRLELMTGRMKAWPVCALPECASKPEAHHPDYSRTLDVVWLCKHHHTQAHSLVRKTQRNVKP